MNIVNKKIGELKPYENNPRHNENAVPYVVESIKRYGFKNPIIIDKDNVIVAGHTRYLASKELGLNEVPCIVADDLTEDEIKEFRLVDNRTAEMSDWDDELLASELEDIDFGDFDFGFEVEEIDAETEAIEDNYEPQDIETRCNIGDLWQLGNHKLICGDSTDVNVIERLMDGVKADVVFCDAPYGVSAVNSEGTVIGYGENHLAERGKYAPIIGDDTTETAQQAYDILSQICDKLILWGGNYFLDFLPSSDGWLIWDKRGESGIRNNFADGEMAWCSFHTPIRIYHQLWNGMIREGEHEKRVHPTQKPIRMLSEILKDFSKENEVIVDVFGGSGSTLIACEQLNRKCFMCELDEHYCDVIIDRWETFTGEKAVLINE